MQSLTDEYLDDVIELLPGYDPDAQAGDCYFDYDAARDALQFVHEHCTHVKGELAGKPIDLEPWQQAFYANVFGWKRPDGTRRYRETLVFIPRKNAKTTMAAALACLMLYTDGEPGAECYSSAAERDQARLCFEITCGMIRNDAELAAHANLLKYSVTVGSGTYKAISAQAGTKHGFNAHLVVNDELHAHKTRELTDVLSTSMGSRRQPLIAHLTTSDYEREGSICNEKHDYATKVRDGIIDDPAFLPVIYEAARTDDWTSPEVWATANPNMGVSVSEEFLARECKRAQEEPQFENEFKRLHLNIRTEQAFRWMPIDVWDGCAGAVDAEGLIGQPCYAGLDLATVSDMAALVLAFPQGDEMHLLPFFWCPEDTAAIRERKERQPYVTWARQGLLDLTPGNRIDYRHIRAKINELAQKYTIEEIAFDPWNATQIATELAEEDGFDLVEFRQGTVSMNEPMKTVMRLALGKQIRHGGHPILRWNANNIAARTDPSDNVRPDKSASGEKIDGMVAAIMAVGRAALAEPITDDVGVFIA